jgi:hypothetical protein
VGSTTGSSTLTATVYDSSNNPLGGQPVAFSIINPTSGGETIAPVMAMTATTTSGSLSLGMARTSFTSGSMASGADGIKINALVVGTTVATGTSPSGNNVAIVIGGMAGSIAFGQATVIGTDGTSANYVWPMSILVADSNGNPVSGAIVSLSLWPIAWSTGVSTACMYDADNSSNKGTFYNEDINENLILDSGEDGTRTYYANGSTASTPGTKTGYLIPVNSQAGTLPATVTTDSKGVASFNLTYPKQSAIWTVDRIRATTIVQGSETRGEINLRLEAVSSDVSPCLLTCPYVF